MIIVKDRKLQELIDGKYVPIKPENFNDEHIKALKEYSKSVHSGIDCYVNTNCNYTHELKMYCVCGKKHRIELESDDQDFDNSDFIDNEIGCIKCDNHYKIIEVLDDYNDFVLKAVMI